MFSIKRENNVYRIKIFGIKISINACKNYLKNKIAYNFYGQNNKLLIYDNGELIESDLKISGLDIDIRGNNNTIIIDKKSLNSFGNSCIKLNCNDAKIKIDETNRLYGLNISACCGNHQQVIWGKNSNCWGVAIYLNEENATLIVGEDCMFSGDIRIWPTDGHAILDVNGNVLNNIKSPTRIGNHVWIGTNVTILKNTDIKDNSIIGASSVVANRFMNSNIAIAGNPARVVKENINWDRKTAYIVTNNAH